jgi:hypothetical protein
VRIEIQMGSGGGAAIYLEPSQAIDIVDDNGVAVIRIYRTLWGSRQNIVARTLIGDTETIERRLPSAPEGE